MASRIPSGSSSSDFPSGSLPSMDSAITSAVKRVLNGEKAWFIRYRDGVYRHKEYYARAIVEEVKTTLTKDGVPYSEDEFELDASDAYGAGLAGAVDAIVLKKKDTTQP